MATTISVEWTLGDYMAKARRSAGISTSKMASTLGVTRKTINNYESGRTTPSVAVLRVWVDICDQPWFTVDALSDMGFIRPGWLHLFAGHAA